MYVYIRDNQWCNSAVMNNGYYTRNTMYRIDYAILGDKPVLNSRKKM